MSKFHMKPIKFVTEVVLKVEDLNRSTEFYKNIMGLKILSAKEKEVILTSDGITPMITIIQPEDVIPKLPRRTGLYHFALLLPNRLDLGLFLKHIRDKKYPIIGGSNHGVSEAIYFEDPDDNGIEVYADTPTFLWHKDQGKIDMVTKPLDYNGLLDEAGERQWNGIPKETIIGHIHLHVGDLDLAQKFYIDGLGFDLVMEIPNSALFLSSEGYHHHIGLNIWNGKNSLPLPNNSAGMKYYTLLLSDDDSRQNVIENLEKLGYEVIQKENKIFTKDPANNLIELAI